MNIDEIIAQVESEEYLAQLNIASGKQQFLEVLSQHTTYLALLDKCKTLKNSLFVLSRIERLIHLDIDIRFENPNDVALATYLHALSESSSAHHEPVIAIIGALLITQARQIWWSRFLAETILLQSQISETTQETIGIPPQLDTPQPRVLMRSLSETSLPIFGHLIRDVHLYTIARSYDTNTPLSGAVNTIYFLKDIKNYKRFSINAVPLTTASHPHQSYATAQFQWR